MRVSPRNPLRRIGNPLRRIRNPLRNLSRAEKIALGVGGSVIAIATIATIAWAATDDDLLSRPIVVAPGCASFDLVDQPRLRDELRQRIRSASASGPVDPFAIAARYVRSLAPSCATYPARTNLPGEAKLFAVVFSELITVMQQDSMLTEDDVATWYAMMQRWAQGQGVSIEELQ